MVRQKPHIENLDSLMGLLESNDYKIRTKSRESLVAIGGPAVSCLSLAMRTSEADQVRWEAAKALVEIKSPKSIPSFLKALEDHNPDVAWLAAEGLEKFGKEAWPKLLLLLIKKGTYSFVLRQGAHHILRNQREVGSDDLMEILLETLVGETGTEGTPLAAYNLLAKIRERH
jgi:hypothetical protein